MLASNQLRHYAGRFDYANYLTIRRQAEARHLNIQLWNDALLLLNQVMKLELPRFARKLTPFPRALPETLLSASDQNLILQCAKSLIPWRVGPFQIGDLHIDAEWDSRMKWRRIQPVLSNLEGQIIADIGCNNGFFMYQLAEKNPSLIVGFDPSGRTHLQFKLIQHFMQVPNLEHTLLQLSNLRIFKEFFHTILCLGVIYHRRNPLHSLQLIKNSLRPGGTIILESIIVPGDGSYCLCPQERFAKMKNVYFVPTRDCLLSWMTRTNFCNIEILDISPLTSEEQRRSEFAPHESLEEFQDACRPENTAEGYPWPLRATVVAKKRS